MGATSQQLDTKGYKELEQLSISREHEQVKFWVETLPPISGLLRMGNKY